MTNKKALWLLLAVLALSSFGDQLSFGAIQKVLVDATGTSKENGLLQSMMAAVAIIAQVSIIRFASRITARRKALILLNVAMGFATLGLAFVGNSFAGLAFWQLAKEFAYKAATPIQDGFLNELLPPDENQRKRFSAFQETLKKVGELVGMAAGPVGVALIGTGVFIADAATFGVLAVVLFLLPVRRAMPALEGVDQTQTPADNSVVSEQSLREWLFSNWFPVTAFLLTSVFVWSVKDVAGITLLVSQGIGTTAFGGFVLAEAIGQLAMSAAMAKWPRLFSVPPVAAGAVLGMTTLLAGVAGNPAISIGLKPLEGAASCLLGSVAFYQVVRLAPGNLGTQASAFLALASTFGLLVGKLGVGFVADATSPGVCYAIAGAAMLFVMGLLFLGSRWFPSSRPLE